MGILTKMKQRPDSEKKLFSLVLAGVITLVIVMGYFSFSNSDPKVEDESGKLSSVSPIQMIKDEFSKAFSGFGENSSSTPNVPIEIIDTGGESVSTTTSTSSNIN
jgi:hypothetical protein